jgi:phage terminase large subunit GpA-like protein
MNARATTPIDEVRLLLGAFASGLRPRPRISPAEWVAENLVVPDGPAKGKRVDLTLTPYVAEILDNLGVDKPWTEIAVKKSGQSGLSLMGIGWLLSMIDMSPDDMMIVQPTIPAAREFAEGKLDPAIAATRAVAKRVKAHRSRAADGSKTLVKKFPNGRLILTGANSATELSSKTVRFALADEVDRWPVEIEGQGDPMGLLDARQSAFTRAGTQKKLIISTPTNKGGSRIDKAYASGDQRHWFMPCPHCGTEIGFRFENLKFERHAPYGAHYVPECCGAVIEAWQQRDMVLSGRWKPTCPGPGRQPSYFINALVSLLTSWDVIADKYWKAQGDPIEEKSFTNLVLGESWDAQGSEIDAGRIVAAAEDYPRNVVPRTVGRLILCVDTQDDRFEWAVWGFGPPETGAAPEQWLIAAGVVTGDMFGPEPWIELDRLGARLWEHAGGRMLPVDLRVIDSGGHHTQAVYEFVRGKRQWRALKGGSVADAPIIGTPKRQEVKDHFGRVRFRVPLYMVNSRPAKAWLSHALKALSEGNEVSGRIHLTREIVDQAYADQLTAEVLVTHERTGGRLEQQWERLKGRANEALDLAVYARCFAYGAYPNGLAIDRFDRVAWTAILDDRHGPVSGQLDLLAPKAAAVASAEPTEPASAPPPAPAGSISEARRAWSRRR